MKEKSLLNLISSHFSSPSFSSSASAFCAVFLLASYYHLSFWLANLWSASSFFSVSVQKIITQWLLEAPRHTRQPIQIKLLALLLGRTIRSSRFVGRKLWTNRPPRPGNIHSSSKVYRENPTQVLPPLLPLLPQLLQLLGLLEVMLIS